MRNISARIAVLCVIAMGLAGCGTLQNFGNAISAAEVAALSASVSPKDVVIAASAYDVVAITATNYQRLRRCDGTNGPVCRDPALRKTIDAAIYSGRAARNNLKAYLRAHPNATEVRLADYDTLVAATETIKKATAAYSAAR